MQPERIDPRTERSRAAGLAAARAILVEEGWSALTHLRVAERSGLHRATVYRHWPTVVELLQDVLASETASTIPAPTGELRGDLIRMLQGIRDDLVERDFGRVLTALIDRAEWDEQIFDVKVAIAADGLAGVRGVLQSAIEKNLLPVDLDPNLAVAQLVGPVLFRRLFSGEALPAHFIASVVDAFLAAFER